MAIRRIRAHTGSLELRSEERWGRVRRVILPLSFSLSLSFFLFCLASIVGTASCKWVPTSELVPLVPLVGSSSFAENSIIMIAYDVNDAPGQQLFPSERARDPSVGGGGCGCLTIRTEPRDVDGKRERMEWGEASARRGQVQVKSVFSRARNAAATWRTTYSLRVKENQLALPSTSPPSAQFRRKNRNTPRGVESLSSNLPSASLRP